LKFNRKVAVTLGDPSGVGPEVFLKSLENKTLKENLESILVVSDPMVLKRLSRDISHNLKLHDSNGFSDLKADSINFFFN
jgi:4-hydroxy-L-threonine phosphate dehydrogenase PdxA